MYTTNKGNNIADNECIGGYSIEEWEKIETEFYKDLENHREYDKPFRTLINEILKNETSGSFAMKTELEPNMFSRLKHKVDDSDPCQKNTIITICVAYNLDLMMAQALMHSLGSGLNGRNKNDYAYAFILTRCRGKTIEECNDILKKIGLKRSYLLGEEGRRKVRKRK